MRAKQTTPTIIRRTPSHYPPVLRPTELLQTQIPSYGVSRSEFSSKQNSIYDFASRSQIDPLKPSQKDKGYHKTEPSQKQKLKQSPLSLELEASISKTMAELESDILLAKKKAARYNRFAKASEATPVEQMFGQKPKEYQRHERGHTADPPREQMMKSIKEIETKDDRRYREAMEKSKLYAEDRKEERSNIIRHEREKSPITNEYLMNWAKRELMSTLRKNGIIVSSLLKEEIAKLFDSLLGKLSDSLLIPQDDFTGEDQRYGLGGSLTGSSVLQESRIPSLVETNKTLTNNAAQTQQALIINNKLIAIHFEKLEIDISNLKASLKYRDVTPSRLDEQLRNPRRHQDNSNARSSSLKPKHYSSTSSNAAEEYQKKVADLQNEMNKLREEIKKKEGHEKNIDRILEKKEIIFKSLLDIARKTKTAGSYSIMKHEEDNSKEQEVARRIAELKEEIEKRDREIYELKKQYSRKEEQKQNVDSIEIAECIDNFLMAMNRLQKAVSKREDTDLPALKHEFEARKKELSDLSKQIRVIAEEAAIQGASIIATNNNKLQRTPSPSILAENTSMQKLISIIPGEVLTNAASSGQKLLDKSMTKYKVTPVNAFNASPEKIRELESINKKLAQEKNHYLDLYEKKSNEVSSLLQYQKTTLESYSKIKELQKENEKLKREAELHLIETKELKLRIDQKEKDNVALNEMLERMTHEINEVSSGGETVKKAVAVAISVCNTNIEQQMSETEKLIGKQQEGIEMVTSNVEFLRNAIRSAKEEIGTLGQTITERDLQITELKELANEISKEKAELIYKCAEKENAIKSSVNTDMSIQLVELQGKTEIISEEIAEIKGKAIDCISTMEGLANNINDHQDSVQALMKKCQELNTKLEMKTEEAERLAQANENLTSQIEEMGKQKIIERSSRIDQELISSKLKLIAELTQETAKIKLYIEEEKSSMQDFLALIKGSFSLTIKEFIQSVIQSKEEEMQAQFNTILSKEKEHYDEEIAKMKASNIEKQQQDQKEATNNILLSQALLKKSLEETKAKLKQVFQVRIKSMNSSIVNSLKEIIWAKCISPITSKIEQMKANTIPQLLAAINKKEKDSIQLNVQISSLQNELQEVKLQAISQQEYESILQNKNEQIKELGEDIEKKNEILLKGDNKEKLKLLEDNIAAGKLKIAEMISTNKKLKAGIEKLVSSHDSIIKRMKLAHDQHFATVTKAANTSIANSKKQIASVGICIKAMKMKLSNQNQQILLLKSQKKSIINLVSKSLPSLTSFLANLSSFASQLPISLKSVFVTHSKSIIERYSQTLFNIKSSHSKELAEKSNEITSLIQQSLSVDAKMEQLKTQNKLSENKLKKEIDDLKLLLNEKEEKISKLEEEMSESRKSSSIIATTNQALDLLQKGTSLQEQEVRKEVEEHKKSQEEKYNALRMEVESKIAVFSKIMESISGDKLQLLSQNLTSMKLKINKLQVEKTYFESKAKEMEEQSKARPKNYSEKLNKGINIFGSFLVEKLPVIDAKIKEAMNKIAQAALSIEASKKKIMEFKEKKSKTVNEQQNAKVIKCLASLKQAITEIKSQDLTNIISFFGGAFSNIHKEISSERAAYSEKISFLQQENEALKAELSQAKEDIAPELAQDNQSHEAKKSKDELIKELQGNNVELSSQIQNKDGELSKMAGDLARCMGEAGACSGKLKTLLKTMISTSSSPRLNQKPFESMKLLELIDFLSEVAQKQLNEIQQVKDKFSTLNVQHQFLKEKAHKLISMAGLTIQPLEDDDESHILELFEESLKKYSLLIEANEKLNKEITSTKESYEKLAQDSNIERQRIMEETKKLSEEKKKVQDDKAALEAVMTSQSAKSAQLSELMEDLKDELTNFARACPFGGHEDSLRQMMSMMKIPPSEIEALRAPQKRFTLGNIKKT